MSKLKNTLPAIPRKWNRSDIDTSARIYGRPAIPPFQRGKSVIGLSLGILLQVVKRTITPLTL